jgi:hypothetical protein
MMTTTPELTTDQLQTRDVLSSLLPLGAEVTILASDPNRTGDVRTIKVLMIEQTSTGAHIRNISGLVAEVFGLQGKHYSADSFRYSGAGMDMRFAVGYRLARLLHAKGELLTLNLQ